MSRVPVRPPNRWLRVVAVAAALTVLGGSITLAQDPAEQTGPAVDRVLFNSVFVDRAPLELQAGNIDLYLYGLKTEAAQELQDADGIQLFQAPATTLSLVLNPAPAPEDKLNPFSIPEVRRAMQYLVDREFIAQDLYGGLALPMLTHVSPSDYDFLTVYDIDRGSGIRYDAEYARQQIATAMTAAGAERAGDPAVWSFGGAPIRLKFIARPEDERRQIGDLVRAELEAAGFQVSMTYKDFAPAVLSVYSTDPQAFEWHLYTEGWSRGSAQRYDSSTVNSMNAPWLGNMPGWREQGFWQYENEELDTLGQRLFRGEFQSLEERNEIYRTMTSAGLDESVRVWLVSVQNTFPASADLTNVTRDIVAGPRTPYTLREASIPGKDELRVGNLWVWTERTTYNPIGGFGDAYSNDVWRNLVDPAVWNHPFTGDPGPYRATYEVSTAGPGGTQEVPTDAVTWDAPSDTWVPIAAGTTSVSSVIFDYSKYLSSNWHHGQPITLADAVYSVAQGFDLAYDADKSKIEVALAATSRPYLETIKGMRILDDDRVEVFVDFWHFDEDQIAAYANLTSFGMPWEVLASMDDLVFDQRRAAFSNTAASRYNVPWLSLVLPRDARLVDRTLREFATRDVVPAGVFEVGDRSLVTPEEAQARYAAAQEWFDTTGNLVISNGPFFLSRFDQGAQFAQLDAFRDPTYPFRAGDFALGAPPTLVIAPVEADVVGLGQEAAIPVTVDGPGSLVLRYLLIDPADDTVKASGEAAPGATPGTFDVTLGADVTGSLFPGLYQLQLAASSDAVALISERRVDLEVAP